MHYCSLRVREFTSYCVLAMLAAFWLTPTASADDALWSQLRDGGKVVLIRHATTPSQFGDPEGMRLDDCATQRNLTDAGREQAKRIGQAFAENTVKVSQVRTSQLCRCIDTARLAFGAATVWEDLTGIVQDSPERRQQKAQALRRALATLPSTPGENVIFVTHNFNIKDATGESVAMGEALVIQPKGEHGFDVLGRIPAP
jgi:phosphohistidine phosphatase SixA